MEHTDRMHCSWAIPVTARMSAGDISRKGDPVTMDDLVPGDGAGIHRVPECAVQVEDNGIKGSVRGRHVELGSIR